MTKILKKIARFLPSPLINTLVRIKNARYGWHGNFLSWKDAQAASSGYDKDVIIEKVKQATQQVINGEAVFERDSMLFYEEDFSWPLINGFMYVAAQKEGKLNVLDFGGSLGSARLQYRKFFEPLSVKWGVVEQEKFVAAGKILFPDGPVAFYADVDTCLLHQQPDLLLLGSVLQYMEYPYTFLEDLLQKNFEFLIIDKTPLLLEAPDRLTVQKVPPYIYDASYPAWLLNKTKVFEQVKKYYDQVFEYTDLFETNIKGCVYTGACFKRKAVQENRKPNNL